ASRARSVRRRTGPARRTACPRWRAARAVPGPPSSRPREPAGAARTGPTGTGPARAGPARGPGSRERAGLDELRGHLRVGGPLAVRGAQAGQPAGAAGGAARVADPPAVPDHPLRQVGPVLARDERGHLLLDLHRVELRGPAKPAGQPAEVR